MKTSPFTVLPNGELRRMTCTFRCLQIPLRLHSSCHTIKGKDGHCFPEMEEHLAISAQEETIMGNLNLEMSVFCLVFP